MLSANADVLQKPGEVFSSPACPGEVELPGLPPGMKPLDCLGPEMAEKEMGFYALPVFSILL